jgi:Tol biopolymer transport system component
MNESMDRVLSDWLHEGPESGPREALERSLAATRRVGQRPGWTLPERWIPMELTMAWTRAQRPILAIVVLALLSVAVAVAALVIGAQPPQPPQPFRNGVIAVAKDGDIFVADRPGGDLRPLVAGPDFDLGPMFSPDGTKLAFYRQHPQLPTALMVADADGTNVVQVATEPLETVVFAPDSRWLMGVARIDGEHRIVLVSVDPRVAPRVLDVRLPNSGMELSWSGGPKFNPTNPQEILVAAQDARGGPHVLSVYDLATGRLRTIVEPGEDQYPDDIAWLPDGKHIIYDNQIVAADGSGDRALDALRPDRVSSLSNDGTRIVSDIAEVDVPGDDSGQSQFVVRIDGQGGRVRLACGLGTNVECPSAWIWSPDDSILLGETDGTYLQADPDTGHVIALNWVGVGTPAWQRVAP